MPAAPRCDCLGSCWTGLVWSLLIRPGPICPGSIWGVLIWTGLICGSESEVALCNAWGVLSHRASSLSKAKTRPLAPPGNRWTGRALSFSHRRTVLSSRPKKAAISFHESRRRSGLLVPLCATERPAEPQMKEGSPIMPGCVRLCPLLPGTKPDKYTVCATTREITNSCHSKWVGGADSAGRALLPGEG